MFKHIPWYNVYRNMIVLCFFLVCQPVRSENLQKTTAPQNVIHLDGGTWIYIGNWSVNAERIIFQTKTTTLLSGLGIGSWYFIAPGQRNQGISIPVSINSITGKGAHHFEMDFGLRYTIFRKKTNEELPHFFPIVQIGYRYQQKNGKGLMFRTFIGISGAGIGVGKAF